MSSSRGLRWASRGWLAGVGLLWCGVARGQLSTEVPITSRQVPLKEQVEAERTSAPYRLGPFRLFPFVGVKDAGYNSNAFGSVTNPTGDWTLTPYGGTRFLLPLGGKTVLRGTAAPGYVWWNKLTERRGWVGNYDGEFVGLFNRLSVDLGGGYNQTSTIYSSESEQQVRQYQPYGRARLEVDIFRRLSVFGGYDVSRTTLSDVDAGSASLTPASTLNRTEYGARLGVRYKPDSRFSIGVMGEATRALFRQESIDRNNDGYSFRAILRYDRPNLYAELSGGYAQASSREEGSFFPLYRTGIYRAFVSWFPTKQLEAQGYGWRRPQYSYFLDNPYFMETRNGGQVNYTVGTRLTLSAFGNLGSNTYPVEVYAGTRLVTRVDDVTTWGGGFSWNLWRKAVLGAVYSQDRYASNVPGVDRNVYRVSVSLAFGGQVVK